MEGTYGVYQSDTLCGKVQVQRQGLYYRFLCRCQTRGDAVYRLRCVMEEGSVNLGVLVPAEDGFRLITTVPTKRFLHKLSRFCLVPVHEVGPENFVPIIPEEPFAYIERLKGAYLVKKYGKTGILLP